MGLALTIPSQASQGTSTVVQSVAAQGLCPTVRRASVLGSLTAQLACETGCGCVCSVPMLGLRSLLQPCSSLLLPSWPHVSDDHLLRAGHPLSPFPSGHKSLNRSHHLKRFAQSPSDHSPASTALMWILQCGSRSPWAGRGVGVGHSGETREVSSNQWPCWNSGQLAMQVSAPGDPSLPSGLGPALGLPMCPPFFLSFFSLFF